ncbi:MAG: hypothetical protein ACK5ME_05470 [Parahaliea sp.]
MRRCKNIPLFIITIITMAGFVPSHAETTETEALQDMSDPLAVFTQTGLGVTDKGMNIKFGQTYKPSTPGYAAQNVIEIKGIGGELFDIRDSDKPLYRNVDNSIDSFRFRNFKVAVAKGVGTQLDMSYNVDADALDTSYSFIKAMPPVLGAINFYPLLGAGVTIANEVSDDGYEILGTFAVAGMYAKATLSRNIWLNYNPLYLHTFSGSSNYQDGYYAGDSHLLTHELAISYQINPRTNIRYFANWNTKVDFADGDHRIEINYQW